MSPEGRPPVRGAGIETQQLVRYMNTAPHKMPLVREARIEIVSAVVLITCGPVAPHTGSVD